MDLSVDRGAPSKCRPLSSRSQLWLFTKPFLISSVYVLSLTIGQECMDSLTLCCLLHMWAASSRNTLTQPHLQPQDNRATGPPQSLATQFITSASGHECCPPFQSKWVLFESSSNLPVLGDCGLLTPTTSPVTGAKGWVQPQARIPWTPTILNRSSALVLVWTFLRLFLRLYSIAGALKWLFLFILSNFIFAFLKRGFVDLLTEPEVLPQDLFLSAVETTWTLGTPNYLYPIQYDFYSVKCYVVLCRSDKTFIFSSKEGPTWSCGIKTLLKN